MTKYTDNFDKYPFLRRLGYLLSIPIYTGKMHWDSNPKMYPPFLRTRVLRGRGVGQGSDYLPWLKIRDVPSQGTSSDVSGIKIQRPFHFLSENEAIYFYLIERQPKIVDIREQWPIFDIDSTLRLCSHFNVRHNYRGHYPEPITIDFLLTEMVDGRTTYRAASIKTPKDAADPKIRQRLRIEYSWCRENGIPWTLVDTSSFNKTLLSNLRFIRAWFRHRYEPDNAQADRFSEQFESSYRRNVPLLDLINSTSKILHIDTALATDLFRYCAWANRINFSLHYPIAMDLPLVRAKNGNS